MKPRLKALNVQAVPAGPREVTIDIESMRESSLFNRDVELEREVYESNGWIDDVDDELETLTVRDMSEMFMWLTEQPID